MYICICNAITERQIVRAVADGARTVVDLQRALGIALNCGACAGFAEEVLEEELEAPDRVQGSDPSSGV